MKNYEMQDQYNEVKSDIIKYLALEDGQDFSDWTLPDLFDLYVREVAIRARKAETTKMAVEEIYTEWIDGNKKRAYQLYSYHFQNITEFTKVFMNSYDAKETLFTLNNMTHYFS